MCGGFTTFLSKDTTHLIADRPGSAKYKVSWLNQKKKQKKRQKKKNRKKKTNKIEGKKVTNSMDFL